MSLQLEYGEFGRSKTRERAIAGTASLVMVAVTLCTYNRPIISTRAK